MNKKDPNTFDLTRLRRELEIGFDIRTASSGTDPIKQEIIPSTGHCAAVAWIVNQRFGGEFVSTKLQGQSHWFNRVKVCYYEYVNGRIGEYKCAERDVDLTGDQFGFPVVNIGMPGQLYTDSRVRKPEELKEETIERAKELLELSVARREPRPWSIVRFKKNKYDAESIARYYKDLLDKQFIYFGEIPNSLSHGVFLTIGTRDEDYIGKFELFRHVADFEEVPDEET